MIGSLVKDGLSQDTAASVWAAARQAGACSLDEQERLEEAPPGSAGVPPACYPVACRSVSLRCGTRPPCRRERHGLGRSRVLAPLPVDPGGGDGRGCARHCAGGTPALPGGHHRVTSSQQRKSIGLRVYSWYVLNNNRQFLPPMICPAGRGSGLFETNMFHPRITRSVVEGGGWTYLNDRLPGVSPGFQSAAKAAAALTGTSSELSTQVIVSPGHSKESGCTLLGRRLVGATEPQVQEFEDFLLLGSGSGHEVKGR